jgi:extracellular elastinolytic metalloproteinase
MKKVDEPRDTAGGSRNSRKPGGEPSLVSRALVHALNTPRGLTHAEAQAVQYVPGDLRRLGSGLQVVQLDQEHLGVPVVGSGRSVRFDARGAFLGVTGRPARVPSALEVEPAGDPVEAVYVACRHLADELLAEEGPRLELSHYRPRITAWFAHPSRPTVLRKPPFRDPILARLVVDGEDGAALLAWEIRLGLPEGGGNYEVLVSAAERRPRVLGALRASSHADVRGRVFHFNPDENQPRTEQIFPLAREVYPRLGDRPLPIGGWTAGDATSGRAGDCRDFRRRLVRATSVNGRLRFDLAQDDGLEQATVSAFYVVCLLHDFFHLLGFDEAAGNFSKGPAARGRDTAVRVTVWDRALPGHAFFESEPDGRAPRLQLGRLGARHTAFDADIVMHEYVHGVTNRMIGGRSARHPLRGPQPRALGEGLSDYFALSIQNHFRRREGRPERTVYGHWISGGQPTGLRSHAYDDAFPGTYGSLGKSGFANVHDAGSVWCQTLLEATQALGADGDVQAGQDLAWRLVFDSLALLHPGLDGPTYLHARDTILQVLDAMDEAEFSAPRSVLRERLLEVFRRRGMGPAARSSGAGFEGIREDTGGAP